MISVIIPVYNRNDVLKHNILALINQGINEYEVVVADDGGNTNTKEMLYSLKVPFEIKYYWHEKKGFRAAKTRNEGVKISSGDKLVLIDQDVILAPNTLKQLNEASTPNAYHVGTKKLVPIDFYKSKINDDIVLNHFEIFESQHHGTIKATISSLGIIHRENFEKVQGFDEQFEGYGLEDTELMSRLKDIGIKCFDSQAIGYHIEHSGNKLNNHNRFLFSQKYKNKTKTGKQIYI